MPRYNAEYQRKYRESNKDILRYKRSLPEAKLAKKFYDHCRYLRLKAHRMMARILK